MTSTQELVFDPFSDDFFNHPYETYKRMRDEAPVYYNETYDFWALSRHADVAAAFKNTEVFSSAMGIELEMVQAREPLPSNLIMTDPPEHRQMRSLINKVFTPRAMLAFESYITEQIHRFLGQVDPAGFDVVHDFSALFPVEIITHMLGVPPEHRQQVRLWIDLILSREYGNIHRPAAGIQASLECGTMYYKLIQERRAHPQDDMISRLIETEVTRDDGSTAKLDDVEIAGFATLLGGAGAETVTKLIGNAIVTFADHPDQWQLLVEDRSKVPGAVEELLRYQAPSQYMVRYAKQSIELHGTTIPEGAAVLIVPGSANRDERAFTDPDRFDVTRKMDAQNLGFGYGVHSCLGAALARMESRIALEALLDFMPRYELDREGLRRVAMTNVAGYSTVPVRVVQ